VHDHPIDTLKLRFLNTFSKLSLLEEIAGNSITNSKTISELYTSIRDANENLMKLNYYKKIEYSLAPLNTKNSALVVVDCQEPS
jgi:hypothetical protein